MYAIVECGGRQYRAEQGHTFSVEKLPYEVGEQIVLDNVLLVADDGNVKVGQPSVTGASVQVTVTEQYRGKKIFVWKYKPKKRYRRRQGHRQYYTRLRVDSLSVDGSVKKVVAKPVAKPAPKPEPKPEPIVEAAPPVVETPEPVVEAAAVVETPEPVVEAAPVVETPPAPVVEAKPDDLKKIEGIGPKVAGLLIDDGITTFKQLADASNERLQAILDAAGSRYSIIVPDSWPEQASLAAKGNWDALEALQDRLDGGKYVDGDAA